MAEFEKPRFVLGGKTWAPGVAPHISPFSLYCGFLLRSLYHCADPAGGVSHMSDGPSGNSLLPASGGDVQDI